MDFWGAMPGLLPSFTPCLISNSSSLSLLSSLFPAAPSPKLKGRGRLPYSQAGLWSLQL